MEGRKPNKLILFLLMGELTALAVFVFGLWRMLSENRAMEESLVRGQTFLSVRAADALLDEQHRCMEELLKKGAASSAVGCDGSKEGSTPFHWFVESYPFPGLLAPIDEGREGAFRKRIQEAFLPSCQRPGFDLDPCGDLAQDLASAGEDLGPQVTYWGAQVLARLEPLAPHPDAYYPLRYRLERIQFKEAVRRHNEHFDGLPAVLPIAHGSPPPGSAGVTPLEVGAKGEKQWIRLDRYALTTRTNRTTSLLEIIGFDTDCQKEDIQNFLIAKNVIDASHYEFFVRSADERPLQEEVHANIAFMDDLFGFLVLKDPQFPQRLAGIRMRNIQLWSVFLMAGVVLIISIFLAYRAAQVVLENVRMRENFVASVSHEFRSPLASLRLMLESLTMGKIQDPQKVSEYLQIMQRETLRLSRLAENILTMGRLRRTKESPRVAFSPRDVVQGAILQLTHEAQAKEIEIDWSAPDDLPNLVGDPDLVQTALINLLDNAIKYSPTKGRVRVEAGLVRPFTILAVEDQGPGIPKIERQRVFEFFYRISDERVRETKGTGLGLAIVNEVALRHGGEVIITDLPQGGARVELKLPLEA